MRFFDTETCGLTGPITLIQYSDDDGPVILYEPWREPISKTLALLEETCNHVVCGFNIVYDWFHWNKLYNLFSLALHRFGDICPIDRIEGIGEIDREATEKPKCLKPAGALDLMLHARKTKFQSLMERKPIIVRKVPVKAAAWLCGYLNKSVTFDDIFFARAKNKERWKLQEVDGEPEFRNVVLKFRTSMALKPLIRHIFSTETIAFQDIMPERMPQEILYAPYCRPHRTQTLGILWKGQWPYFLWEHVDHWRHNHTAREYAAHDVVYLKKLLNYFGNPAPNDNDSILACLVGAARWKGWRVNVDKIRELRNRTQKLAESTPTAPNQVAAFLSEKLSPLEQRIIRKPNAKRVSTSKAILETIQRDDTFNPEARERAKRVLEARRAAKELELYDKLIFAERFHASFKVIGTLSSRMSGTDDLNPQGIKRDAYVKECFPLADDDCVLWGGDFDSFEVTLADAEYNDPELRRVLLSGKKIHALFGVELYPHLNYEQLMSPEFKTQYSNAKSSVFAMIYGGDHNTIIKKYGIPEDIALAAFERWNRRYPVSYARRLEVFRAFQALTQPEGLGTRVDWKEPADFVESFLGFRRYFPLENRVCKALFMLGNDPPEEMSKFVGSTVRKDRKQTIPGATRSALLAAAFNIQSKTMRAAGNHKIQNPGAIITKDVQCAIWEVQPVGVHDWYVQPLNIHDEIMCPIKRGYEEQVAAKVKERVEKYRPQVPLIKFDWVPLRTWADKDGKMEGYKEWLKEQQKNCPIEHA